MVIKNLMFFLVFLGLIQFIFADTNGVWTLAQDIRPGIFGSDELGGTWQFSDNVEIANSNNLYFLDSAGAADAYISRFSGNALRIGYSKNSFIFDALDDNSIEVRNSTDSANIYLSADGHGTFTSYLYATQFCDIGNSAYCINPASVSRLNTLNLSGDLYFDSLGDCNLETVGGKLVCGTDNVGNGTLGDLSDVSASSCSNGQVLKWEDGSWVCGADEEGLISFTEIDGSTTNELPLAGTGITVSDRTVNVNTSIIATQTYVNERIASYLLAFAARSVNLVNSNHDVGQCDDANGVLVDSSGNSVTTTPVSGTTYFCKFTSSSCLSGWDRYGSWSTTNSNSNIYYDEDDGVCPCSPVSRTCSVSGHSFSNKVQETKTCSGINNIEHTVWGNSCSSGACTNPPNEYDFCSKGKIRCSGATSVTVTAPIAEIGCY